MFKKRRDNMFKYREIENRIEILGLKKGQRVNDFIIPEKIKNKKVVSIGDYAFYNNKLESVIIPSSVGTIGENAFQGIEPDNINWIGHTKEDFWLMEGNVLKGSIIIRKNLVIPSSVIGVAVTSIGEYAFKENQLESVEIPDSVVSIGERSFAENKLTSVEIPDSVISIGKNAFQGVEPNNINWKGHTKEDFWLMEGNVLKGSIITSKNLVIPSSVKGISVKEIGYCAFYNSKLESVIIPNSIETIGDLAFSLNQLTEITIPDSVKTIGYCAFNSDNLTSVEIGNSVKTIGKNAFQGIEPNNINWKGHTKEDFWLMEGRILKGSITTRKNLVIPFSVKGVLVKEISALSFAGCQLTSVEIPDSVETIGEFAFLWNDLTSVEIPNSVTKIGKGAFRNNQLNKKTLSKLKKDGYFEKPSKLEEQKLESRLIKATFFVFIVFIITSYLFYCSILDF